LKIRFAENRTPRDDVSETKEYYFGHSCRRNSTHRLAKPVFEQRFKIDRIDSQWNASEVPKLDFAKVCVNHRIRKIHDDGVDGAPESRPLCDVFSANDGRTAGWREMP
jgi:hypothetical protein